MPHGCGLPLTYILSVLSECHFLQDENLCFAGPGVFSCVAFLASQCMVADAFYIPGQQHVHLRLIATPVLSFHLCSPPLLRKEPLLLQRD